MKTNDIEQKYVDMTGSVFLSEINPDEKHILRQIAYNIAHLADEVRALRRDYEIVEGFVDGEEQETEDEKESESTEDKPEDKKETCFICGKKLNIKDASGVIHNGDETYCCCQKCSGKFDALIDHFIMPTSMFF